MLIGIVTFSLLILLTYFYFTSILSNLTKVIPGFERVSELFTNFDEAISSSGSTRDLAKKIPIFPKVENKRSMLFIENLHSFFKLSIDNNLAGTYFPQNEKLVNTSTLVKQIDLENKKKYT